jgi:hypothetical protein
VTRARQFAEWRNRHYKIAADFKKSKIGRLVAGTTSLFNAGL